MLDSQLIVILGAAIDDALAASSFGVVEVVQKAQPTQEGTPTGPTIFFEKLFHLSYGFPMVGYIPSVDPSNPDGFTETVEQLTDTTFQISSLYWQDPAKVDVVTASDLLDHINMFLRLPGQGQILREKGAAILRVRDVRNPYFENDNHQFEAHPSFDIVFTHSKTISMKVGGIIKATSDLIQISGD